MEEPSILRLYLMRIVFLMNFLLLGLDVWPEILGHAGTWQPMGGAAFSFWGALSVLSVLGLRYPVKMIPLLLLQFVYKSIWLLAVAGLSWSTIRATDLGNAMAIGIFVDAVAIPWSYVARTFVASRGDRWRSSGDPPFQEPA